MELLMSCGIVATYMMCCLGIMVELFKLMEILSPRLYSKVVKTLREWGE